MAQARDLPSAHAPLRDGSPVSMFHGFDDDDALDREGGREGRAAERVAARFAMNMTVIPFQLTTSRLSAAHILFVLRAHGVAVDAVQLALGSWPGQADLVCIREGRPALFGALAIDLRVDGGSATIRAEIRLLPGE